MFASLKIVSNRAKWTKLALSEFYAYHFRKTFIDFIQLWKLISYCNVIPEKKLL